MLKQALQIALQWPYRLSAPIRGLPDFMLIGAQKSGTTSLFHYLSEHPEVARNPRGRKEMYFFNKDYARGLNFYRQYFPLKSVRGLVGEGSTVYLHSEGVPSRVAQMLPDVKILAVLREPAARAISHYFHHVQRGRETRSIEDAFSSEVLDLYSEGKLEDGLSYRYLNNGDYGAHLEHWLRYFPKERFMLIQAERLFAEPQLELDGVCDFLGIDCIGVKGFVVKNRGSRSGVVDHDVIKARLYDFYLKRVDTLEETGILDFIWNSYAK
jgi:hypothetical protein